eukprot:3560626-Prymnesium_polylepis.1
MRIGRPGRTCRHQAPPGQIARRQHHRSRMPLADRPPPASDLVQCFWTGRRGCTWSKERAKRAHLHARRAR